MQVQSHQSNRGLRYSGPASEDVIAEIRLSLHHVHLPKLAAAGLIVTNSERQFVEPTEQFEQVQPTVSTILDADPTLEAPIEL